MKDMEDVISSSIFITFSGDCKKALTFYQKCFGGLLQFETFGEVLEGYPELPIVSGSLISDSIRIYGSDLVHDEGRKLGNYMAIFLDCKSRTARKKLIAKLEIDTKNSFDNNEHQKLIEVTDAFEVRWILGV